MTLEVSSAVLTLMREEAIHHAPREACGILLGRENRIEQYIPTINVHPKPLTHFEIDPGALIACHKSARDGGLQVMGYFHSHPDGRPEPSGTDARLSAGDGRIWVIFGGGELGFWRATPTGFEPVSDVVERT